MRITDPQQRIIARRALPRSSRSPTTWSASIGALRSMSRSIEAISGELGEVNIARLRATEASRGSKPLAVAMARAFVEHPGGELAGAGGDDIAE